MGNQLLGIIFKNIFIMIVVFHLPIKVRELQKQH